MMRGSLHIFELGHSRDNYNNPTREYQLTYAPEGESFSRTLSGDDKLEEFLSVHAALDENSIAKAFSELRRNGHVTIPNVDIPVDIPMEEAVASGMIQGPTEA